MLVTFAIGYVTVLIELVILIIAHNRAAAPCIGFLGLTVTWRQLGAALVRRKEPRIPVARVLR